MKKLSVYLTTLVTIFSLTGCGRNWEIADDATKITVAASVTPHAEILNECKPLMTEKGYELEVKEFTDYVLPNTATEDGSVQANYFQHAPYLDDFNATRGTHLVSVGSIHYEPFGIYAGKLSSIENLPTGSTIIVPNDGTNETRALYLLQQVGLIELKDGVGITATKLDIKNDNGYKIVEADAASIAQSRPDAELVVLNGNYALAAGLTVQDALALEDGEGFAAKTYSNILAVRDGNQDKPIVKALLECLMSEEIKNFILEKYNGSVVPMF